MLVSELITKLTAYMSQEGNHAVEVVDGAIRMLHPDGTKQVSVENPDPAAPSSESTS